MIKSGGSFFYKGRRFTIGAVISFKGLPYMITVSHVFRGEGDHLTVDGMKVAVTRILKDFDLALIELPPACTFEITELGSAFELEQAALFVKDLVLSDVELLLLELPYFFGLSVQRYAGAGR